MHILLFQFIFLSILAFLFNLLPFKKEKSDFVYMIIAFIPMWYIHSMVKVGTVPDLSNYEYMFWQTQFMSWKQCFQYSGSMEAGYLLLNKFVSLFTKNYYVFQGLYGAVLLFLYLEYFVNILLM